MCNDGQKLSREIGKSRIDRMPVFVWMMIIGRSCLRANARSDVVGQTPTEPRECGML